MQACVAVKAFDTALEALQRAEELGLQFFRGDAYYAVMKGAVLNKQLDLAIKYKSCCPLLCVCHSHSALTLPHGIPEHQDTCARL